MATLDEYDYLERHDFLETYLKNNNINIDILNYAKNEGLDINYITFIDYCESDVHYLVTSNTLRKPNNGYRLITISKTVKNNTIIDYRKFSLTPHNELEINYESINMTITKQYPSIKPLEFILGPELLKAIVNSANLNSDDEEVAGYESDTLLMRNLNHNKNYDLSKITHIADYYKNEFMLSLLVKPILKISVSDFDHIDILPFASLKKITFLKSIDKFNPAILPITVETIIFNRLRQKIDLRQCHNLKKINFGLHFNDIFALPDSCETIIFGDLYDRVLPILPTSLKSLIFGKAYNQIIYQHTFQNATKLETIMFGRCYNQILPILPNSIKRLELGELFNQEITSLPLSLEIFTIGSSYDKHIESSLFTNLTTLIFNNDARPGLIDITAIKTLKTVIIYGHNISKELKKYLKELQLPIITHDAMNIVTLK